MSHTLLDAVNETLKRANVIVTGNLFTGLTDSAQQHTIDIAVQVINEGIDELYSGKLTMPLDQAETTITLATNQREYALASDLIRLIWPFKDLINFQYIYEYPGDYNDLLLQDPQQNMVGLSFYGKISPVTGKLRLIWQPDSTLNGRVYTYEYQKNVTLVNATDAIPFNDEAFRAMVPAWVQLYKREMRDEFDQALWQQSIGRATRMAREEMPREDRNPR